MPFLTLSSVRQQLWNYASKVPYAARVAADTAQVDGIINQACERFITGMSFRGTFATARLRVFDEQITLPNPLDGIRSLRLVNDDGSLGRQYEVFSQQANFASGSCFHDQAYYNGFYTPGIRSGGIRDLGDDFPTFRDGAGTFYIRCKSTKTETPATIILRGLDENGAQIFSAVEGVSLAVTTATTTTTQKFTALTSWVRSAASAGVIRLYAVDTTTGEEELLVNITPQKLTSGYRRYSAPGFAFGQTVEALCNISFVTAVNDNDPVLPANLGALKLGVMALQYEDKNDTANAAKYWGPNHPEQNPGAFTGGFDLLEKERDSFDGDEVSNVVFAGYGQAAQPYLFG